MELPSDDLVGSARAQLTTLNLTVDTATSLRQPAWRRIINSYSTSRINVAESVARSIHTRCRRHAVLQFASTPSLGFVFGRCLANETAELGEAASPLPTN